MRFGVLGPLAVWTTDGQPVRVPEVKVRALLADLLVQDGGPVSAGRLAEDLWGEQQPGNPANTLQTKVSQLRRALEQAEPGGRELVTHHSSGYLLRTEPGDVDAQRFRALTARARESGEPRVRVALLADALALWRGPALADFADEPFAASAIQRLEEERLAALEEQAAARLALGEDTVLTSELAELTARHPFRERLVALHLRALYRAGRQNEALESYSRFRRRLDDELGLTPGPELTALHQAILEQDPTLDGPPGSATRPRTNLPAPLTGLVGRTAAVLAVRSHLGDARLVTLTGPGGVGKTSLAAEAARGLAGTLADGAWLVELAGLDRQGCPSSSCPPDEWIAEAIADALGIREDGQHRGDLTDRLADALRTKELLLVLDNCEHLVEPLSTVVTRLLGAAPGLRILATSQEPIGLAGELIWAVPPLEVPGRDQGGTDVLGKVRDFSAVRLFTARAVAAAPGFVLGESNAAAVAAICRALDGIPLALELAATRVRALGVHELLARLDDRFRLLNSGHRGAPVRQRTLRAMIDWSWELLTEPEQVVLRRLAVHFEGCGLDAAEAVGGEAGDVPGLLARLVDRSLVVVVQGEAAPRYRLLESVAAYCLERVREAGELEELQERHARFHLALAERADPLLRGREQKRWLEKLDTESANLRAAVENFAQLGQADLCLRLALALTWYRFLRGRLREARRSLRTALAIPGGTASLRACALSWQAGLAVLEGAPQDHAEFEAADDIEDLTSRARAQWFLGYVVSTVGELELGEKLTGQALAGFQAVGDSWGIAAATCDRVSQVLAKGDLPGARADAETSAGLFQELGDRWGLLQVSFAQGTLAAIGGDYQRAARLHRDGLRMAEELGLWTEVSYQLSWLGRTSLLTGDHAQAREFHTRAMRLAVEQGFKPGEMYAETGLALGYRREGEFELAERHLLSVLDWHRRDGSELGSTLILAELGFVAEQRGDVVSAQQLHLEGFALARRGGDPRAIALALEGLAGVHALAGEPRRAARLLGAAAQARESVGTPLPAAERADVERATTRARASVGAGEFAAEFAAGAGATLDELANI